MMSNKKSAFACLLAGGLLWLAPGNLKAQTYFWSYGGYNASGHATVSGSYYSPAATPAPSNNGSGKQPAAKKIAISTATLLKFAWEAETNANNVSGNLPKGAVLNFNGSGFEIDVGTNLVADLTGDSIMSFAQTGTNDVLSTGDYGTNGAGVPPYEQTVLCLCTVTFDTPQLSFYATGLATVATTVSSVNNKGIFSISGSLNLSDGTGEGIDVNGNPTVITGVTLTASGKASINTGGG
jgi:hypothetical protein